MLPIQLSCVVYISAKNVAWLLKVAADDDKEVVVVFG